jgi:LacI family transcriptional regulator
MNHVSLKDVAAEAGVSLPTVSKVLQGKGTVSPQTRATILHVAESLGYVPNVVARSLVSQKTSTIGIVVSDFGDVALSQIFVGACQEVDRQGLSIVIGGVDPTGEQSVRHLRTLLERRVDGIVLIAPHLEKEAWIADMLLGRLPVVSTHPLMNTSFSLVNTNSIFTGSAPTQHLIALGHSRIGTITGKSSRNVTQSRLLGYRQALEAANIPYHSEWVEEGDWQITGGYKATRKLLERVPDLTAIYAQNDTMAVGVLSALRDLGVRVPEDCAVVGCDDIPLSAHIFPSLTTMHIPFYEIGEVAVKQLLDLVAQRVTEPQQTLLSAHLISRDSSGRCSNTA